ncbi:MAG: DUF2156 domain-containing protein [Spirochaetales bacterium]|nr:DUF2156 domain-containing protein [Spirochaetales bacterium]
MKDELYRYFDTLTSGVAEYSFANLFLFRDTYHYHIAFLDNETLLIAGEKAGERFCILPKAELTKCFTERLLTEFKYIKCVSQEMYEKYSHHIRDWGYELLEDRDNFDYLYLRSDLAELPGKKYHKKRNMVKNFLDHYVAEDKELSRDNKEDALYIINKWKQYKEDDVDYKAALEAIELSDELRMKGRIYYINNEPVAYVLGESLQQNRSFLVQFEKADHQFKGIYQYINQDFVQKLPENYEYINREQDLGDPGLRQAKESYRPYSFVKKYRIRRIES